VAIQLCKINTSFEDGFKFRYLIYVCCMMAVEREKMASNMIEEKVELEVYYEREQST